jgi:uncharacterized iron-regulated membrane protein
MRPWFVFWHRWVGLVLALLLVIIGATGSVIAWFDPLDEFVNPHLRHVEPMGERLPALRIREIVEAQDPRSSVYFFRFPEAADESWRAFVTGRVDPVTGAAAQLDYDEVFANPYTGERLGQRLWGDFSLQPKDLVTQIYFLHYSLVLPEALGTGILGWVALIWALDCVFALVLTFPLMRHVGGASGRGWWSRWKSAWGIKWSAGTNRVVFDVHRAASLWIWAMLLVFAISGFALNLPGMYEAGLKRVTDFQDIEEQTASKAPLPVPAIGWDEGLRLARQYMSEQAAAHDFTVVRPLAFTYRRGKGAYFYRVVSDRDLGKQGKTTIGIDGTTGKLMGIEIPTGQNAGNTLTSWATSLHMAAVGGWLWRICVSLLGLAVMALSITGVAIYLRKRQSRRRQVRTSQGSTSASAMQAGGSVR